MDLLPKTFTRKDARHIDLSASNRALRNAAYNDPVMLSKIISEEIKHAEGKFGYGGYFEDRLWYQRSDAFFKNDEPRTIHLGLDIWIPPCTPIFAPCECTIHSFKDNDSSGDYGPTIIVECRNQFPARYALFGHLSRNSLKNLYSGKVFSAGECLCEVGDTFENGEWPPHLHLQFIEDLGEWSGDFPGVSTKTDLPFYKTLCPDPTEFFMESLGRR